MSFTYHPRIRSQRPLQLKILQQEPWEERFQTLHYRVSVRVTVGRVLEGNSDCQRWDRRQGLGLLRLERTD